MRTRRIIVVLVIAITGIILLAGCNRSAVNINNIEKIELTFSQDPVVSRSCTLTEKNNIKEGMRIFEELETYASPDIKTAFQDVIYKITYKDGKLQERKYSKIRPVADIFKNIIDSQEVRKQWEDIFNVEMDKIESLKLLSKQKNSEVSITDKDQIAAIIASIKTFNETVSLDKKYFALCEAEYYDTNGGKMGSVLVVREDQATNQTLAQYNLLNQLKVVPADIESIKLTKNDSDQEITVEDPELISLVLENYHLGVTSDSAVSIAVKLKNDSRTHLNGSFDQDNIPDDIDKLLK